MNKQVRTIALRRTKIYTDSADLMKDQKVYLKYEAQTIEIDIDTKMRIKHFDF